MPELSDRVLARTEQAKIPALDRLKMRLKALTAPDELRDFNDSEILAPGYVRQQNEMAEHIGQVKPYGRDESAEIEYRDVELVEKYHKEQQSKKDAEQPQKLRTARQEYTDEFMAARRKFMRKQRAEEKKRKQAETATQKTEPPDEPSEAVIREQDRLKKIAEGLRPKPKNDPAEPPQPDTKDGDNKPDDAPKPSPSGDTDTAGPDRTIQEKTDQDDGAKPKPEEGGDTDKPDTTEPIDPRIDAIHKALKARGMEGMGSQIKIVQDILDKAKKSGRTLSIEDAIREMRGEQTPNPSLPGEEKYQEIVAEGARARQENRGPLPEPKNYSSVGLSRKVNFNEIAAIDTKQMEIIRQQRSPTLKDNPRAELSISKEAELYFERQPEEYSKEIESLANQIQTPMGEQTKAVVCIPVAGHQESANIYQTLENFIHQDAPNDQYEILLFVNWPEKDQAGDPLNADATLAEITRFQEQYPDLPVRLISKQFSQPGTIGQFRKYLTDVALWRSQQRANKDDEVIFISNDADQKGVAPKYISNFINEFGENNVDGMLGQLDWSPADYVNHPLVHTGTRLFQYLNTIGRHRSGGLPSSGANFAFKGSMYAAIGGYLPDVKEGEDIAIGRAIVDSRQKQDSVIFAGARSSRLYTSARRAIDALKKGLAPVEQWDQGFGVFDDEVRLLETGTAIDINYDDPAYISKFKVDLESVINRTLDIYEQGEKLGKGANFYRKALGWMGVSYDVVNGNVVITDMKPLIRNLKEFEVLGPLQQRIKSGKASPEEEEIYHKLYERFVIAPRDERRAEEQSLKDEMLPKFPLFRQSKLTDTSVPSETLVKDAAAQFEPQREIEDYFARQDENYMKELATLNSQIEVPMSADTEMAVLIPVAGAQEAGNIYRTLESYSKQSLDTSKFEVVLLVNVPEGKLASAKGKIEQTMAEIDRAKHDFPQLQVRVAKATLPDKQVKIGNIRKMLTDIALLRQQEAGISRDLLLLSNDADNKGISEDYLTSYQKYFQDNPDKEGAVGNLHFDPSGFVRFPGLHLKTEFVTRLDQTGFRNGNVTLFGSNSVMKSSIYAAIGGYPTNLKSGEQEWTGSTIRQLRRTPQTLGYVNDAVLTTSIRRGVASYLSSAEGQIAFGDESAEATMRALDIEAMPMYEFTPENSVQLSQEIGTSIDHIIRAYEQGEHLGKDSYFYREALRSMGIEYEVEGDPQDINSIIKITDISGFIERNKAMRELIEQGETNMAVVVERVEKGFGGKSEETEREVDDAALEEGTPHEKKKNKVFGWVKNIAGNAMSRVRKPQEPNEEKEARFPLPSPEMQKAALEQSQKEYQQQFQAAQENYTEPKLQAVDSAVDAGQAEEDEEVEENQMEADTTQAPKPEEDEAPAEAEEDTSMHEPQSEAHPEKMPTDYDQAVSQFVAENNIELSSPELQRFILYVKSNNRTDLEQAYDDYLRETAPKEKQPAQESSERSGNPIAEAALGIAALAENTAPQPKPAEEKREVTEDMTAILKAGQQNNAEPWYDEFVRDTDTLKHLQKPGLFRSLSKEQLEQFDRIMETALDRMSDIPAYESNSEELLKIASRNLEFAKAICQRNSPARKILREKIEDFIRDDFHAMHYMHEYEHKISENPLSLFSVTNRDGSFYKGLLAATFRNKELHHKDLANILGIPEVRELLKQAIYGFEVRTAEDLKKAQK